MMFVFLCHISLSVIISMSIHVTINGIIALFPWLNTILAYPIFCIHSSVNGRLGCFHVLLLIVNIGVHVSFLFFFFFVYFY